MIPREANYSILAHCDCYAVASEVETKDRPASTSITPLSATEFKKRISEQELWKKTYNTLVNAYRKLKLNFEIVHDDFGGYRLIYSGKSNISSGTRLREVVGFIRPFPDGAVTELSIMEARSNGDQLLLLGPVRFVNSHCNENCAYDYTRSDRAVQLVTKKQIKPGDELFVRYGNDFFDNNECLCTKCNPIEMNESKKPPTKLKPKNRSKFDKADIRVGGFIKDFRVEADAKAPKVYVVKSSALRKKKVWFEPKVARHTLQIKKEKEICEEFKINFYGMPLIENWFKEYLAPDVFDVRTTTVYRIYAKRTGEEKCKRRKKPIEIKDSIEIKNNQSKHVGKQDKFTNQKEKSMSEQVAKKRKIEKGKKSDKEKKRKEKKSDEGKKNETEETKVSSKKEQKKKLKKEKSFNLGKTKEVNVIRQIEVSPVKPKIGLKRKALTNEGGGRKKKGKRGGKKWRKLRKNPPQITKRHGRKIKLKVISASKIPQLKKIVKLLPPLNPDDYLWPLKVRRKRPKKSKTNCVGSKKSTKKPKVVRVPVEPTRRTAPRKAKFAKIK